jgi:hypothetical protein
MFLLSLSRHMKGQYRVLARPLSGSVLFPYQILPRVLVKIDGRIYPPTFQERHASRAVVRPLVPRPTLLRFPSGSCSCFWDPRKSAPTTSTHYSVYDISQRG